MIFWHHSQNNVQASRTATVAAMLLTLVLIMPAVCLALPSFGGSLPGSCHGHHAPVPNQSHRCCYAKAQAPTTALTVQGPALDRLASDVDRVGPPSGVSATISAFTQQIAFSPPTFVLRV